MAIVDSIVKTRERLRRAVRRLGHTPVTFDGVAGLLEECTSPASPFGAVLLVCPGEPQQAGRLIAQVRTNLGTGIPLVVSTTRRRVQVLPDLHLRAFDAVVVTPATFESAYRMLESFFHQHRIAVPDPVVRWGAYRFLLPSGKVEVAGDEVKLGPIEFDLAIELFRNLDRPLTREWLWATVWEKGFDLQSRSLDTNMSGLRRKLGLHTGKYGLSLQSIWGTGYQLSQAARAR
jgi:DNA-binding response OmpR family regulator